MIKVFGNFLLFTNPYWPNRHVGANKVHVESGMMGYVCVRVVVMWGGVIELLQSRKASKPGLTEDMKRSSGTKHVMHDHQTKYLICVLTHIHNTQQVISLSHFLSLSPKCTGQAKPNKVGGSKFDGTTESIALLTFYPRFIRLFI